MDIECGCSARTQIKRRRRRIIHRLLPFKRRLLDLYLEAAAVSTFLKGINQNYFIAILSLNEEKPSKLFQY